MAYPERVGSAFPDQQERKPAILIVEDEVLIRFALADYLQECGFKVFETASAAEAVEILECREAEIDLVFTDIFLSGAMSGFALAEWIRANLAGMPVVLASGDSQLAKAARDLRDDEPFVTKPYDLPAVVMQFRSLINAKKA